jgi:hypothetical protein
VPCADHRAASREGLPLFTSDKTNFVKPMTVDAAGDGAYK